MHNPHEFRLSLLSIASKNLAIYGAMVSDGTNTISRALAVGDGFDVADTLAHQRRCATHAIDEARAVLASIDALEVIAAREAEPARRREWEAQAIMARLAGEE